VSSPEKITRFWGWWGDAQRRLADALDDPAGRRTAIDEVHARLRGLGLDGDVVRVSSATDLIVGSPARSAEHRIVAAHWLAAAPPSERFAFATHRPAQPIDHLMTVRSPGDPPLAIAEMRFARRWRTDDDRVDLVVHVGPRVAELRARPLGAAVLRSALGELEMASWVGGVTVSGFAPQDGVDLATLIQTLRVEIALRAAPRWVQTLGAAPDDGPVVVMLRRPLQPERHPFLDGCATIRTELQTDDPAEGDQIHRQLLDGIPGDVLATGARTSHGWRTTYIAVNRRSPSVALLRQRAELLGGEFTLTWDPAWEMVRRLAQSVS
jgi:hypothetical protein